MTGPLVTALAQPPGLRIEVAKVVALDSATNTLTVIWGDSQSPVSGIRRLSSYSLPAAGDVVYVLIGEHIGMVALGSESLAIPPAPGPAPDPAVVVQPTDSGSYARKTHLWTLGNTPVSQTPDINGAWFYNGDAFSGIAHAGAAGVELQLQLSPTSGPLTLVMISPDITADFAPLSPQFLVRVPPGVLGWVALPLSWLAGLRLGYGIGLVSDIYQATVVSGGTVRITPL